MEEKSLKESKCYMRKYSLNAKAKEGSRGGIEEQKDIRYTENRVLAKMGV